MLQILQIVSLVLISVGMALSLAHVLELPGKLRLPKDTYIAVQTIYYPGFTIGGFFGEFGAMLMTFILLLITPSNGSSFWPTLAALVCLLIMHGLYWVVTHPVNKFWLQNEKLGRPGAAFFGVGARDGPGQIPEQDWVRLRNRWEHSHVARAVFAMLALIALAVAATNPR